MNPLPYSEREITDIRRSRIVSRLCVAIILVIGIFSWAWITPSAEPETSILVMVLWFSLLLAAIAMVLWIWRSPANLEQALSRSFILAIAAVVIALGGLAIGFLSGDKFDAVRAVIIALTLIILNRPGQTHLRKA